ncbi:unnamed protein product [Calicophoron daubneyi]|uniref:Uncharacterized protein n=1 Tax=Calicophoron daubneyi TaxID=300641 RepID=A0AAV2TWS6_CALDB
MMSERRISRRFVDAVDQPRQVACQDTNNQKLIYYCLHQPDKLDRVARYLLKRLSQDVNRRYDLHMYISIEAINMLIKACHGQRPVLAQVFLQMVHLLLQTNDTDLQILAAKSFVEFSQIEDDVPNYFKEYNDLIDHFTSMAHASLPNVKEQNRVRMAGICGIQGVVRKTVGDQLHLDEVHGSNMDKIIPSLLLNICERPEHDPHSEDPQDDPSQEAVFVFKDIVCRASYNNIKPVVASILTHLDNHKLWDPPDFPLLIFQYLLDSIENTQIAHTLVKQLVAHLSQHESNFTIPERTCMVQVIGLTVISLAKNSIGPDVFHNFKALLQILRASIDKSPQSVDGHSQTSSEERLFQDAIIKTIAEFAKNLPDTQKIEILKFILNFEPMAKYHPEYGERPRPLIMVLLQTMLTVATQYQTVAISNALNSDFLNLLLRGVAVDPDPAIRIIVQKILHTLIDRHGNAERLLRVQIYLENSLETYFTWEEPSRQDILFMKKTGILLTENIYHQLLDPTNKVDCLEHLFCTFGLVALEMGADQVIGELFRLILAVQKKISDDPSTLPLPHRCAIHALLASAMSLLVQLVDLPDLRKHVEEVIRARATGAPYLLPAVAFNRSNTSESYPTELDFVEELLFSPDCVSSALSGASYDVSTLGVPYPSAYVKLYEQKPAEPGANEWGLRNTNTPNVVDGTGLFTSPSDERHLSPDAQTLDPTKTKWAHDIYNSQRRRDSAIGPTRSESSYSLTDSLYSAADSARAAEEMYSFKTMQKIVTNANESRKGTLNEDDRLLDGYLSTDLNDLFAQQRQKTLSVRAQLAEILDDISIELHPPNADANVSQRKLFSHESFQGSDQMNRPKTPVDPDLPVSASASSRGRKKKKQQPLASWERDYSSLFLN